MLIQDPPTQIAEHMWMLGTPAFPVYLYRRAREATLFEGAVSAVAPVLERQLAALAVAPEDVTQAVVTHAHPDHVMAIPLYRCMFPNVTILASATAAKTLQIEKAVGFFRKIDGALTDWLMSRGEVAEPARPANTDTRQIGVDRTVGEGDQIEIEGEPVFTVLETPGHSDCSLSFHAPAENILVISDATGYYLPADDYMWPGYLADFDAYCRSIARLASLHAELLCLSHNVVVRGGEEVAAYFQQVERATAAYHDRIVSGARSGMTVADIAQELAAEVFDRTGQLSLDFFCKNCTLLIKQSLHHEGIKVDA